MTQKILKKKPRKSVVKNAKPITKNGSCPSLFNSFNPPHSPEDDDDYDIDEDAVSLGSLEIQIEWHDPSSGLRAISVSFLFCLIYVLAG